MNRRGSKNSGGTSERFMCYQKRSTETLLTIRAAISALFGTFDTDPFRIRAADSNSRARDQKRFLLRTSEKSLM